MDNEDKKIYAALAALACVVLLAGLVWFLCAGRSDVSDIRRGAQSVTEQLTDARTAQQREASDITEAGRAVERSEQAVTDSKDSNRELQERERTDSEIIRESQSIIDRVRERGTEQDTGED